MRTPPKIIKDGRVEDDRRAQLLLKRRHLLLRQERANASRTFRTVAPLLCEREIRFAKSTPEQCRRSLGTLADGPGQDERLLWTHLEEGVCRPWADRDERDRLLKDALAACTAPDETVAVIWHTHEAGLRLKSRDLAEHSALILDPHGDTIWIVAAAGGRWLIELAYWDRELCYIRSMPPVAGAH